jgi:5-methylcytosine-specific restriction endonuclease McrA
LNQCSACKKAYIAILRGREDPAQRAERLARKREHSRAWKKRNKDKIREYTRRTTAANTARHEKWRRANPERFKVHIAASNYKRRQKKKGGMTGAQTRAWMDAQKKICHWCGKNCADLPTIDHLTPLSKGGMHEADNLVIACKPCNSRKHAKDPIKFAQELGRLL